MQINRLILCTMVAVFSHVYAGHAPVVKAKPRVVTETVIRPDRVITGPEKSVGEAYHATDFTPVGENIGERVKERIEALRWGKEVVSKADVGSLTIERQEQAGDVFALPGERAQQELVFKPQVDRVQRVEKEVAPVAEPVVQAAASVLHLPESSVRKEPSPAEKLAIEQAAMERRLAFEAKRRAAAEEQPVLAPIIISPKSDFKAETARTRELLAAKEAVKTKAVADEAAIVKQAQEVLAQKRAERQAARENAAATRIQAVVRGDQVRMQGARKQVAATQMQALFRGHRERKASRQRKVVSKGLRSKLNDFAQIADAAQKTKFLMKNPDVRAHLESQNKARTPVQVPTPVPASKPATITVSRAPVPALAPVKKLKTKAELAREEIARKKEEELEAFAQQRMNRDRSSLQSIATERTKVGFGSSSQSRTGALGVNAPGRE